MAAEGEGIGRGVPYLKSVSGPVIWRAFNPDVIDEGVQWQFMLPKLGCTICKRPAQSQHFVPAAVLVYYYGRVVECLE